MGNSNNATAQKSPKRIFMIGHELGYCVAPAREGFEHPASDSKARQRISEQVRDRILAICRDNNGRILVSDIVEESRGFNQQGNETELEFAYIVMIAAFQDEIAAQLAEQQVRATSEIYGVWIKNPRAKAKWGHFTIMDVRSPSLELLRVSIQHTCQVHGGRLVNISRDAAEGQVTYEYAFPSIKEKRKAMETLRNHWTSEQLGIEGLDS